MNELNENRIWEFLLLIRDYIKSKDSIASGFVVIFTKRNFNFSAISPLDIPEGAQGIMIGNKMHYKPIPGFTAFQFNNNLNFNVVFDNFLGAELCRLLLLYLPVCYLPILAEQRQRTVTFLHLAQTLDGRIATSSGNSKWIGNPENLKHAHRMRALCDAVLIGSNTLRADRPRLTVRHVNGPNPVKIVVGNNSVEFSSLQENGGKVIYLTPGEKNGYTNIEHITMSAKGKLIAPMNILKELYKHNILSLYVEGGSITASGFLRDHSADFIQLYVAPKIFGSGITNFSLPEISQVESSISFHHSSFTPMGDGILFSGSLQQ